MVMGEAWYLFEARVWFKQKWEDRKHEEKMHWELRSLRLDEDEK